MTIFNKSTFDLSNKDFVSIVDELPLWSAPFGLMLLDKIKLRPNLTVLDIGFGLGFPILEVAQRLGISSKVYGIDPWKAAIERAQSKIDILGIKNVELIEGAAENIPLPDNSIDLIASNNGINNVQDLERVLRECKRIAKPAAQFAATVNLEGTMIEFYSVLEKVLLEKGFDKTIAKLKKHIYDKRRPLNELIELFEKNDFRVQNTYTDYFKYRYLNAEAMFNHSFIRLAFLDSWLEVVPSGRVDEIFTEVEKRLNEIARTKGELVLTIPFVLIDAVRV